MTHPPNDGHPDMTALLGPAALDLLTAEEQRELDQHLAGCARCRAELADLQAVTRRLAGLGAEPELIDDLEPSPVRAEAVLAAVAGQQARERRRAQQWRAAVASAAAAVVLAAGVVTAVGLSRDPAAAPLEGVTVVAAPGTRVDARADLVAHTWGLEIKLVASGLAAGEPYTVEVRTADGEVVDAGAFLGTGERPLLCNLNAAVLRPDATSFSVRDRGGTEVLSAAL